VSIFQIEYRKYRCQIIQKYAKKGEKTIFESVGYDFLDHARVKQFQLPFRFHLIKSEKFVETEWQSFAGCDL
jgi:hypothetical protein